MDVARENFYSDKNKANVDQYDFVEKPSEDVFCPVTFDVLLDPYQTRCCGNHLSREAYQQLQRDRKHCPMCNKTRFIAVEDKYHRRKVLSLKVRCPHKSAEPEKLKVKEGPCGCKWEGELGSLKQHLSADSTTGQCEYVSVDCPNSCGERVQRRNLEEHKSQHCPLRSFTCQYCNYEATYQDVTKKHWQVCKKYPVECPNGCGEKEIELQHLKEHLEKTCPLEVIECNFSFAGCETQLRRRVMAAHTTQNIEAHLSLLAVDNKQKAAKIKEQEDLIKKQEDRAKQLEEQVCRQEKQLGKQSDHITALLNLIEKGNCNLVIPPVEVCVDRFEERKEEENEYYSLPFYSHPGGYKMCLSVDANGRGSGKGTHVSVYIHLMKGEFDNLLKWPFHGDITIKVKKGTSEKHSKSVLTLDEKDDVCCTGKPKHEMNSDSVGYPKYISHSSLYSGGYLRNNSLVFCVSDVVVHSK